MPHNVLVVDDSPDIHDLVRVGLIGEAIGLRCCADGPTALAQSLQSVPDLILLDVDMPGTNGFEVCRRLKADPALAGVPVVFLTGASSAEEKLQGLELGAIDYVTKPFDLVELRARVRAALRTKDLMDRLAHEAEHLRAHAQVLRQIAEDAPLADIQSHLIQMAEADRAGHAAAAIVLLRNGRLELTAPSLAAPLRDALNAHLVAIMASLCSDVASRGQSSAACDPATDPRWGEARPAARAAGFAACRYALIRGSGGDVLGAACLLQRDPAIEGEESRAVTALLDQIAALLSIAVDHRQLADHLEHRAEHDALTGLPNRALLDRRLNAAVTQAANNGRAVAVLFVDVDRFKLINDTMGHLVGDLLLCQLVERLESAAAATAVATGTSVTVARLGGDEFAIVLPDMADRAEAVRLGQRVVESLKIPFQIGGHELFATVSLGLACFPEDGRDTVTLQKNADTAMYRVKHGGRNGLQCFDRTMERAVVDRLALESALRHAIERDELELHFQPLVDRVGSIVAAEALLRWTPHGIGPVSPAAFIPIAEECGLIVPIGAWALRRAARDGRTWLEAGSRLRVNVNVSAAQFAHADFVGLVREVLHDTRLPPDLLELEITESMLTSAATAARLVDLKKLGVSISIDDFGTGYSSLAALRRLPVDTMKIDRSFIAAVTPGSTAGDEEVIRAIVAVGHALGKAVVAEGVETVGQRALVTELGVDLMQGFLFGGPQPAAEFVARFRRPVAARLSEAA